MDPSAKPFKMEKSYRFSKREGQRDLPGTHVNSPPRRTAGVMSIQAVCNSVSVAETAADKSVENLAEETEALTLSDWEIVESPEGSKLQAANPKTNAAHPEEHPKLEGNDAEAKKNKQIEDLEKEKRRLIAMIKWHSDASIEAQKQHGAKEEELRKQIAYNATQIQRIEAFLEYEFALKLDSIPLAEMDDLIAAKERKAKAGPDTMSRASDHFW